MSANDGRSDWVCRNCQSTNYSHRRQCRECNADKPDQSFSLGDYVVIKQQKGRSKTTHVSGAGRKARDFGRGPPRYGSTESNGPRRSSRSLHDLSNTGGQNSGDNVEGGQKMWRSKSPSPLYSEGHSSRSQLGEVLRTGSSKQDFFWRPPQSSLNTDQTENVTKAKAIGFSSENQRGAWNSRPFASRIRPGDGPPPVSAAWSGSKQWNKLGNKNTGDDKVLVSRFASKQKKSTDLLTGSRGLAKLLDATPDQIVLQLQLKDSGYDLILENPEQLSMEQLCVLLQVLARACETCVNKESLKGLFTKTFQAKFVNHLIRCALTASLRSDEHSEKNKYFDSLWIVLDKCARELPKLAIDQICDLVESCLICQRQGSAQNSDLIKKFESIKSYLENEKEKWNATQKNAARVNHGAKWLDTIEPPDSFREISIIPTTEELNDPVRPFVRRNIVRGKYFDVEHYLDVQFRLLREDFVRPLRDGIQELKGNGMKKNRDISVYKNVKILGTDILNFNVIHNIKLEARALHRLQHSKKLMYGNLVCLSHNNFKTVLFGSIFERKLEKLREGILSVKFDSEVDTFSENFIMVESKAYFTAYKHVLKALQRITEDTFPMEDFIVHVDSDMPVPEYLSDNTKYDLQVIRNENMMKTSERYNSLFPRKRVPAANDHAQPALQSVFITRELEYWPSCSDLGLDDSQRRALRSALTSKLSIIQGPPGTGKTFLGLKIAQVLMHNSNYWKSDKQKSPILIVCYTNHALDQFLEGMLPYTNSIVRVGSRSKSEILKEFQINNFLDTLHYTRSLPREICEMARDKKMKLASLETKVRSLRKALRELREPVGITSLNSLEDVIAIPDDIIQQFRRYNLSLSGFLMDPSASNEIDLSTKMKIKGGKPIEHKMSSIKPSYDEAGWQDAEDLYFAEENERILDEEDLVGNIASETLTKNVLQYETSREALEAEIRDRTFMEVLKTEYKKLRASLDPNKKDHLQDLQVEIHKQMVKLKILGDPSHVINDSESKRKLDSLVRTLSVLKYGLGISMDNRVVDVEKDCDILSLTFEERWSLYKLWLMRFSEGATEKLKRAERKLEENVAEYKEIRDQKYLHIMRHASVIGLTTTGAADNSNVLQALQPKIVIVEEAAEILEAHVITALTKNCQHLIMIGDHQQLQPSAAVYELATKYGLETSLFERLIKNGIAYDTLEYQHRMRPSISRLLVPSIYPKLKDHESVHKHPRIRGMEKDVFFITHNYHEDSVADENHSKANTFEGELIMALCRHLMLQGYSSEDLTVLTPYSGQYFLLKEVQRNYEECTDVRISIVDNFQGEESNIILLSLVRSNEDGAVGFLRKENRVCVALSRAKHGLYIAGNMNQLKESSDLWGNIHEDLMADDCIGGGVGLQCENHPEVLTYAKTADDFLYMSPEGGCRAFCTADLPICGHRCPKRCHVIDPDHVNIMCPLPCPKTCERSHKCPRKCWEECPLCEVLVPKIFPCGHINKVFCCEYDLEQPCTTKVSKILPICQHEATMNCCDNAKKFPCPKPCEIRLPCGHKCARNCHLKDDPDHFEYLCKEPCPRSPEGCSMQHECKKRCYEECGACTIPKEKIAKCGHSHKVLCSTRTEDIECNMKCKRQLNCGHFCPRKCKEECGGCSVMVKKIIQDCQHETEVKCSKPALKSDCNSQCKLSLPCGHKCQALCRESCTSECKVRVPSERRCPHGHEIKLPCYLVNKVSEEIAWVFCSKLCGTTLNCGHLCKGKCGQCLNGRMHVACGEKCEKPLVCGHICKADCSKACPPCQAMCPIRCQHSYCGKKCGEPCSPCQEKCQRSCQHHKCNKPCREKCAQQLCEKACKKTLKCGHPCVGFCGDPCPPLCRKCHKEELTEIFFGSEDEANARFVLLDDCGHVFEAQGLREWLSQEDKEIGMKSCPRCKSPIYNNRRYHEFIVKAYANVSSVQKKYYNLTTNQLEKDIQNLQKDLKTLTQFESEVQQISKCLPKSAPTYTQKIYNSISDNEITLWKFQVKVLSKINSILMENKSHSTDLKPHVNIVKKLVMEQRLQISPQMTEEIACELQRISFLPPYWTLNNKLKLNENDEAKKLEKELKQLMDPTVKFDEKREEEVKQKLKESEKYVGLLGITDQERLEILKAMGLKQGHWYKCPRGHIYCITECGGAMEETNCPNCDAKIGGSRHTLRSDNAVATEMDGAQHSAWSQHYNNIRNFHLDD